ncbi:MAG: hypothetical protein V1742_03465, partial [Pseudomonadota bacterium]
MTDEQCRPYLTGQKRAYVMVSGRHQFFPRRELESLRYSIEETYNGLYQTIREHFGCPILEEPLPRPEGSLTYARYGLWHYVKKEKKTI